MNHRLVIIGAGGHGRVCAEIAELNGYSEIIFLDDRSVDGVEISGKTSDFLSYLPDSDFFVAIGNNKLRQVFFEKMLSANGNLVSLIHPNCTVSKTARIGIGSVVMAGVVVNAGAVVGKGVILNTCSSVDHDCRVEDYSHISVGAHLAGTVTIGKGAFIGAGAVVSNNLSVISGCIVGAASAVIHDLNKIGTYVGVPARKVK